MYAYFMHAYTYMGMHAHTKVPKNMNGKFIAFKTWFGTNFTSSGSHSKPLFSNYKKPYMVPFHHIENPKGNHKIH